VADVNTRRFSLSAEEFINGGTAWQLVRKGVFNPELFGFAYNNREHAGIYHVAMGLIRDAGALLKHESEFHEKCGLIKDEHILAQNGKAAFLDNVSEMILSEDIDGLEKLVGPVIKTGR